MEKLIITTLLMALVPSAFMAVMSFVLWDNAFKDHAVKGFIIRASLISASVPLITYFLSGGKL